ncbi:aldose epimerase family protein [Photobacterium salinisoli]|uniref:aldose epimerase family protein n=1 Tax=Photobacterium salinisoli TaxID=1616783 RepID=UPI000EA0374C|nr:aldose epimerase family protein [Photobacterium salinisoli]
MACNAKAWGDYHLYTLTNDHGTQVDISDLGASLVNFVVRDKDNQPVNIVLGYESPEAYLQGKAYIGGVVGPWANRIASGQFELDGKAIQLEQNEGSNHLHGAGAGLHNRRWQLQQISANRISLSTSVNAGEAGYPASISILVCYSLTENNTLVIDYQADPDGKTPVNLTHHAYFNLNGGADGIADHDVQIDADMYLEIDQQSIPQRKCFVEDTPMDFRTLTRLSSRLAANDAEVKAVNGFDHCWCLNGSGMRQVAEVQCAETGLGIVMSTDQSGLQFYTGNALAEQHGRGKAYRRYDGFCLEAQCFPNQVNMINAEECLYWPGKGYRQTTAYQIIAIQR